MDPFVIRRDSWHYRFIVWKKKANCKFSPTKLEGMNFCQYWRTFVFSAFSLTASIVFITFGLLSAAALFFCYLKGTWYLITFDVFRNSHESFESGCITIASFMNSLLIVAIIGTIRDERKLKRFAKQVSSDTEERKKEPGLFITKFRSWKNKVCPNVEFR